jgi:hypothetical protein
MSTFAPMRITGEIRTGPAEAHECHGLGVTLMRVGSGHLRIQDPIHGQDCADRAPCVVDEQPRQQITLGTGAPSTLYNCA